MRFLQLTQMSKDYLDYSPIHKSSIKVFSLDFLWMFKTRHLLAAHGAWPFVCLPYILAEGQAKAAHLIDALVWDFIYLSMDWVGIYPIKGICLQWTTCWWRVLWWISQVDFFNGRVLLLYVYWVSPVLRYELYEFASHFEPISKYSSAHFSPNECTFSLIHCKTNDHPWHLPYHATARNFIIQS